MPGPTSSSQLRITRALVFLQVFLLIAMLFAPIPVAAEEPSADPGASPAPTAEATPAPTPVEFAQPTDAPSPDVTQAPDPTAAPTDTPAEVTPTTEASPVPSAEPLAEATPAPIPDPTLAPTPDPTAAPIPAAAPSIASDKDDYAPGELVTLAGTGWQPGESVHVYVNDDWGSSWSRNVDVTADAGGQVLDQFNLPSWFVAQYAVVATGTISGVVRGSFTDSRTVNSVTLNGGTSPITVGPSSSITAVVEVTTDSGGGNQNWRSTGWLLSATAPGTVTCVNHTDHDGSGTYSETFAITAPATAGTYNVYVIAYSNDVCTQQASSTLTMLSMVVVKASSTTSITCPTNVGYSGSAQEPCSATVTGTGGLNQPVAVTYAGNTNAGTATASASFAGDATHFGSSDSKTFQILPAGSTTVVSCSATVTYMGSAVTPCTATASGAGGLSQSLAVTYSNNTNVGTATASATFAGDANHTGSSDSETFTIGPAVLSVTADANDATALVDHFSKVFGAANPPFTVRYSGFVNGETSTVLGGSLVYTTSAGVLSPVGAYDVTPSGLTSTNYDITFVQGTLDITPAGSTVTVTCTAGAPYTYTGLAQTPCTAEATGVGMSPVDVSASLAYANNTNAGPATADASWAGDANHTGSTGSGGFTIDKKTLHVTADDETKTYGDPNPSFTFHYTAADFAGTDTASVLGTEPTCDTTATQFSGVLGSPYPITCSGGVDNNYAFSYAPGELTVTPAGSTVTVTCTAGAPYTYTGLAQTPCTAEATGVGMSPVDVSASLAYANNTNAGPATADASWAGDANHTGSTGSGGFTIDKAALAVTPDDQALTYADAVPAAGFYTFDVTGFVNGETALTAAGYTAPTCGSAYTSSTSASPPTLDITCSGGTADNYAFDTTAKAKLTIDKAASLVTVTCTAGAPYTYTGLAQTPCTAEATGVGMSPVDVSASLAYANNTNAGPATADASWAGDANHSGSTGTETFEITRASSAVTVTCPASQVYTGSAIKPCAAEVTGAGMSAVDVSASLAYTDNVIVGTATADASWGGDANHFGSTGSETFEITKASSAVTVICRAGPYTYSGLAQTPCTATVTGAGGLNLTPTPVYANNTNAGTATASYTYAGDANHTGSSDSRTFTIDPAALSVTADAVPGTPAVDHFTKTFGTANPPFTARHSGFVNGETGTVLGGTLGFDTTATAASPVGAYDVTPKGLTSTNYAITFVKGTLDIVYRFDGFLQPINDTAHEIICGAVCPISVFKAGSTVPVKFQIKRADDTVVFATLAPRFAAPLKGGSLAVPIDEGVYTDPPTPGSTFAVTGDKYQYNWNTKGIQSGFYYRIGAILDDGTVQYVYIGLR